MNGWIWNDFRPAPSGTIRMQHAIKIQADGPWQFRDTTIFENGWWRGSGGEQPVDGVVSLQPGRFGKRLVIPDSRVVWPSVMSAREAQPIAVPVPRRFVGKDFR